MASITTKRMTMDEFCALPPTLNHNVLQVRLMRLLGEHADPKGFVSMAFGFCPLPEYEYRIADVAYLRRDRWEQADLEGFFRGAPDLVIEILSPSNRAGKPREMETLCLLSGEGAIKVDAIFEREV